VTITPTDLFGGAGILVGFALWAMIHGRREKSGPANNWENEDYMSWEADGTWAEGSTHSMSEPIESAGAGVPYNWIQSPRGVLV
jgi:hypothetical protein